MKRYSILLAVGMVLFAWGLSGEDAEPKPVCELKLDGNTENTGSGKLTAAIARPANVRWGEGRLQGKALFLDNDLSNPKKRSIYSAVTLGGKKSSIQRNRSRSPCGSCPLRRRLRAIVRCFPPLRAISARDFACS